MGCMGTRDFRGHRCTYGGEGAICILKLLNCQAVMVQKPVAPITVCKYYLMERGGGGKMSYVGSASGSEWF
jgi:hypothetical protein